MVNKVLLIDTDSIEPNLALMKISSYYKQKGDQVSFNIGDPDIVYASIVFKAHKWMGNSYCKIYPDAKVYVGGSGFNSDKLPDEIEHIMPDYSLYPDIDYSIGFTTRGCFRKCPWCDVHSREGKLVIHSDIYEFLNKDFKHIRLLDNNILGVKDHFFKICDQIKKENLSIDFNQGLDIRLIDREVLSKLKELKIHPHLRFAFDDPSIKKVIVDKVELLKEFGFNQNFFYVLVKFNTTKEQDIERLELLKDLGQRPYVQRYNGDNSNRWFNDLSAWGNQHRFFATMTFKQFRIFRANRNIGIVP